MRGWMQIILSVCWRVLWLRLRLNWFHVLIRFIQQRRSVNLVSAADWLTVHGWIETSLQCRPTTSCVLWMSALRPVLSMISINLGLLNGYWSLRDLTGVKHWIHLHFAHLKRITAKRSLISASYDTCWDTCVQIKVAEFHVCHVAPHFTATLQRRCH